MTAAGRPAAAGRGLAATVAAASVLVGALPRIILAMDALPGPLRPFVWSDVLHLWERGVRDGHLPYRDVFFEYPPLTGAIWTAIETVAASAAVHVALWAAVQAAAAGAIAFTLASEAGPRRTLVFWSLSPQLVLYGSLNFETLALAPLVIGVVLARRARFAASSVAIALGTAVKLFPVAALPVVLAHPFARGHRRATLVGAAAFAVVLAAAFAPTIGAPFSSLESLRRYSVGVEPNPDSVWGLVRAAVRVIGWDPLASIVVVTLIGTAVTLAVAVLRAARRATDPAAASALAILAVLLWSRLYSPQYSLWVLPFFALLGLPARVFVLLASADLIVFATVYPLTLLPWASTDAALTPLFGALAAGVALRHIALIAVWRTVSASMRGGDPATPR